MAQLSPAENPIFPYFAERINNLPTVPQKVHFLRETPVCVCRCAKNFFVSPPTPECYRQNLPLFRGRKKFVGVWEKQLVNLGGGGEIFGTKVGAAADISGWLSFFNQSSNTISRSRTMPLEKKIFARQTGAGGKTIRKIGLGTKLYRI